MRNRIFGAIGMIWGGGVLANGLLGAPSQGSSAAQAGQTTALVFGAILLCAGAYYFFSKPKDKANDEEAE